MGFWFLSFALEANVANMAWMSAEASSFALYKLSVVIKPGLIGLFYLYNIPHKPVYFFYNC